MRKDEQINMSKLDKQFKEEFDNELREGTYAFRKVCFRILAAILIITIQRKNRKKDSF